jgi:hypothetical protein
MTLIREGRTLKLEPGNAIGPENFDTTTVLCEARYQPELMATIEAVVPHCKYRSGYMRGFLRDRPLRAVLTALAEQHFDTDEHGWWRLKADEHSNGSRDSQEHRRVGGSLIGACGSLGPVGFVRSYAPRTSN